MIDFNTIKPLKKIKFIRRITIIRRNKVFKIPIKFNIFMNRFHL
jgi:hypothetical protein